MNPAAPRQAARELDSITSSTLQVGILHYAAVLSATAAVITDQLHPYVGATHTARILAEMMRSALLTVKAPPAGQAQFARQYSLTPKGRRLLQIAKKHLRQLVAQ